MELRLLRRRWLRRPSGNGLAGSGQRRVNCGCDSCASLHDIERSVIAQRYRHDELIDYDSAHVRFKWDKRSVPQVSAVVDCGGETWETTYAISPIGNLAFYVEGRVSQCLPSPRFYNNVSLPLGLRGCYRCYAVAI